MALYRFVGTDSIIVLGNSYLRLLRFGQQAELPDDFHFDPTSGGPPVLPNEVFESVGFTEEELKLYSSPSSHESASKEFLEKKTEALRLLHSFGDWFSQ